MQNVQAAQHGGSGSHHTHPAAVSGDSGRERGPKDTAANASATNPGNDTRTSSAFFVWPRTEKMGKGRKSTRIFSSWANKKRINTHKAEFTHNVMLCESRSADFAQFA
jgi:hypothetical protein